MHNMVWPYTTGMKFYRIRAFRVLSSVVPYSSCPMFSIHYGKRGSRWRKSTKNDSGGGTGCEFATNASVSDTQVVPSENG